MKVVAILLMSLSLALAVEIPVGGDIQGITSLLLNSKQNLYRFLKKIPFFAGLF